MQNRLNHLGDLLENEALVKAFSVIENNPNGLTNELVKLLGKIYLDRYPAPRGCFSRLFSAHNNQPAATDLINCKLSNPYELWEYLAKTIEKLPEIKGRLGRTITNLFLYAFNVAVWDTISSDNRGEEATLPPSLHATQLRGISNTYYAKQFLNELNSTYQKTPGRSGST